MSSLRQIEANRLNAQKSTGPRSAEGKAASRMNALKSGIDAQSNIIPGENAADLQALADAYYAQCLPSTVHELFFVDILIRNDWQLRRLERVESEMWAYQVQVYFRSIPGLDLGRAYTVRSDESSRLQRRKNDILRSSILARQELKKLKAEPAEPSSEPIESKPVASEIGFVPQNTNQDAAPAPDPTVTAPGQPAEQPRVYSASTPLLRRLQRICAAVASRPFLPALELVWSSR